MDNEALAFQGVECLILSAFLVQALVQISPIWSFSDVYNKSMHLI